MKSINLQCLIVLGLIGLLGGCSTITRGTDQNITINTTPPGAMCKLERQGQQIGTVQNTPATINVSKLKHDITIICDKEGYQTATYINDSGWESGSGAAGIALDVIVTAGISSAIDSATGADNRYESPVNITLNPSPQQIPQTSRSSNTAALSAGARPTSAGPYDVSINWANHRLVKGNLIGFIPSSDTGIFKVDTKSPDWSCYGEWWPTKSSQRSASSVAEGQWKMTCDEKGTVTGIYRMDTVSAGAFRGSDGTGEYVEILVSQPSTQTSKR